MRPVAAHYFAETPQSKQGPTDKKNLAIEALKKLIESNARDSRC
jgi:hypothetical protein